MAKVKWIKRVSTDGLRMTVGSVDGIEKYFVADVSESVSSEPNRWRLGITGAGLIENGRGEVKWFATLAGAKRWANKREHRRVGSGAL